MTEAGHFLIDPFAEDIVNDPRLVEYSVPGLNEVAIDRVIAALNKLRAAERPRYFIRSNKALVIGASRAGAGKSHLIGRLFRELSGLATLVNVRPFEDPHTCWKSILMRMVQELNFPDRFAPAKGDQDPATQLELFAHGVLSQIVADHLETNNGNPADIQTLRRPAHELTKLKKTKNWKAYLTKKFQDDRWVGQVEARLRQSGLSLRISILTWLRVLYGYAYLGDDWSLGQSCIDWIQGDPIDEEVAKVLGIRPAVVPRADQSAGELNELAKSRVLDLCRLAGFYRPFLICFDQTETYGKTPELARALGTVITDLTDEAHNQLTLMTVNLDPWEKRLRVHWEQASLDRFIKPFLMLESISPNQARELAEHRLATFAIDAPARKDFWGNRDWFEDLFEKQEAMTVRSFLHHCSARWTEATAIKRPVAQPADLKRLFTRYVDKTSVKPRRLVFDRDTFYWLVAELAIGLEGLEVDTVRSRHRESVPRWRHGQKAYVFGFESSTHWKRWQTIAQAALENEGKSEVRVLVCIRTPELPPIPKPTWKMVGRQIKRAMASRLLIHQIDKHELVRLYAAQELFADALQGDIDWAAHEVASFLRLELKEFWESILNWQGDEAESKDTNEPIDDEWKIRIKPTVRERKFLSLEELIAQLPGGPKREDVLGACDEITQIRVHIAPNMTVLQWQSTA